MSFQENKTRNFRILKIITLLSGSNNKWGAQDLAGYFGVTTRTIYRDRDTMEKMGIPIYYNKAKKSYEISDTFQFTTPNFTQEEARALFIAAREHDNNFVYPRELKGALSKIIGSLPRSLRKILQKTEDMITYIDSPHIDFSLHREKIKEIEKAIDRKNMITIFYFSLAQKKTARRKVEPYRIFVNNGAVYLAGFCHKRDEIRIFRVDRIKRLLHTRDNYTIPSDFSLDEYLGSAFSVERGKKREVVIRFEGVASYLVKEIKWHESQEIEEVDEDEIIFKMNTGSREELKSWILGYGSEAEVIEPDDLRQEIIKEIEKMQKKYR